MVYVLVTMMLTIMMSSDKFISLIVHANSIQMNLLKVCRFDSIEVTVHSSIQYPILHLHQVHNVSLFGSRSLVYETPLLLEYHSHQHVGLLENSDKQVFVESVSIHPTSFTINLSEDTTMPVIDSIQEFKYYFHSFPVIDLPNGTLFTTSWLSTRILEVEVGEISFLSEAQKNVSLRVVNSSCEDCFRKIINMRNLEEGIFEATLWDDTTMRSLTVVPTIYEVQSCDDELVVSPSPASDVLLPPHSHHQERVSHRYRLRGPLAVDGKEGIQISSTSLPSMAQDQYSISMWVRLIEPPTGKYRTLFYKGDEVSGQRTPSIWLLPDSNRMTIRASTLLDNDVGAESTIDIPLNEWTHLTFTFENLSRLANTGSGYLYEITTYINTTRDVSLKFEDQVMLNSGSLHLLHEDSHSGPMALVYDIIVWEGLLATRDIAALVISSSWTRDVSGVDLALQLLYKTPLMSAIDSDRGKQASMFCDEEDGGVSVCETLGRSEPLTTRVFNPADLEDPVSVASLKAANERVLNCTGYTADYGVKLGLYAEAAEHGSPEGLLLWSLLKIYGHESASSLCSFKSSALRTSTLPSTVAFHDQRQGFFGLVGSLVLGNTGAIMPLVNLLLSGVGVPPMNETYTLDDIPLHSEVRAYLLSSSSLLNTLRGVIVDGVATCSSALVSSESALCPLDYTVGGVGLRNYSRASPRDVITDLAIGLLYAASLLGVSEAKAALSYRFEVGRGVIRDEETAAWYGLLSAKRASVDYHALGGEPIVEADRLNDDTEDKVHRGNMGSDDALIQMQLIRAREGHVPSLVAMGDLYYYGARGMPRDQARARDFFMQAAERGSSEGQCGAAGMLLKGEGGDRNVSRAVLLYEEAASNGSIRALNGLGYMFFFGKDLDKNETKAFEYFMIAAESQRDGDSLFNAGYCLLHGRGVPQNYRFARELFSIAANKFGHFDSVFTLGSMMIEGTGGLRSTTSSLRYLKAAYSIGSYHAWIRRGLDAYLNGHYEKSAMCYLRASEIGYEVSFSNAAFIINRKISLEQGSPSFSTAVYMALMNPNKPTASVVSQDLRPLLARLQTRAYLESAAQGNRDSMLSVGHAFHEGIGICADQREAMRWYTRASSKAHALGSFYVATMYHFGLKIEADVPKAIKYYEYALNQGDLQPAFRTIARALLYTAKSRFGSFFFPAPSQGIERIVKYCLTWT